MSEDVVAAAIYMTMPVGERSWEDAPLYTRERCLTCARAAIAAHEAALSDAGLGTVSDGYHTFDELYEHRHRLFIALCRQLDWRATAERAHSPVWRSRVHHDGSMYPGWFVMGVHEAPSKQITYHLPDRLWTETAFAIEVARAPEWDGHTPAEVLVRLARL